MVNVQPSQTVRDLDITVSPDRVVPSPDTGNDSLPLEVSFGLRQHRFQGSKSDVHPFPISMWEGTAHIGAGTATASPTDPVAGQAASRECVTVSSSKTLAVGGNR